MDTCDGRRAAGRGVFDRRVVLQLAVSCAAVASMTGRSSGQAIIPPHPDRRKLEVGDFVWPRKKGMYVPFNNAGQVRLDEEHREWLEQRDAFVKAHEHSSDKYSKEAAETLRRMTFDEFHSQYMSDKPPAERYNFNAADGRFGHVGIVAKGAGGRLGVIEAMPVDATGLGRPAKNGVRFVDYDTWIKAADDRLVWAGRLRGSLGPTRAQVPEAARAYMGTDYWLWNLNLADERHFYCSKLCWLSILKAVGKPVDGIDEPRRNFWFTPKKLINLATVKVYHSPEPF